MKSFVFENPTKIIFGEGVINQLDDELKLYGDDVLLCYGKGAIKKEGIYDKIMKILSDCGKTVTELSGIMPNPTLTKVREGMELCRKENIDFILAVGGGSVIDCAKAIAAGSFMKGDVWEELFMRKNGPEKAIPVGAVLTMVGTGSEMNGNAVITNEERKIKAGCGHKAGFPKFALLDPTFTYSLPKYQMVSGICDIMSHLMEQYFSGTDDNVSDDMSEALLKSTVKNARVAVENPQDYTARSNIMWCASLALNGLTGRGKSGDWEAHQIEHQLGAYFDVAHGMGLAAVTPTYLRLICESGLPKFRQFALNVWGVLPDGKTDKEIALEGIDRLEAFFKEIGAPTSLRELGIKDTSKLKEVAESCNINRFGYKILTHDDIEKILLTSF